MNICNHMKDGIYNYLLLSTIAYHISKNNSNVFDTRTMVMSDN